jgi:hypothetical protein
MMQTIFSHTTFQQHDFFYLLDHISRRHHFLCTFCHLYITLVSS